MNLKKNWKRFWTLSQSREGFTLVELIVVIAIMAILAGVAVPAYSGYINKANKAADLQLLGAINTAFGAACIENGANPNDSTTLAGTPRVALNADGSVNSVSPYGNEFNRYFAGNDSAKFKVITQLVFENGVFVDANDATGQEISYGGVTIKIPQSQIDVLNNSTFLQDPDLGVGVLLNQVDSVAGAAANAITDGSTLAGIVLSDDYLNNLSGNLGMSTDELKTKLEGMEPDEQKSYLANSIVLSVAQGASSMDRNQLTGMLTGGNVGKVIGDSLDADPQTGLTQAAVAYGMYTAYANYTGNPDLIAKAEGISDPTDLQSILSDLNDPAFSEYVNSTQGAADLDGYLSAMDVISSSAGTGSAADSVLTNGFNDPALLEALQGIMG